LKDLKEEDFSWLVAGDQRAFEAFFRKQYRPLVAHVLKFLRDPDEAEEVVQDVFVKLWEKRGEITAQTSLSAYLYTSVRNQCYNMSKHQEVPNKFRDHVLHVSKEYEEEDHSREEVLLDHMEEVVGALPDQCQLIFRMNKFEGMKYKEIAESLDLSVKTVENQMGKALRILREEMKTFASLSLFLIQILLRFKKIFAIR
jgi:RNA polymerase sigma-70 factor (ECF subfamily)